MPSDIAVEGLPSPLLFGTGSPALVYNADAGMAGMLYLQTDAVAGKRCWFCLQTANGYVWENLQSSLATVTSAAFTASPILSGGMQSQTLTVMGAQVGMGVFCAIIGAPSSALLMATGYVSALNTVVVNLINIGLSSLTPSATSVRVLVQ